MTDDRLRLGLVTGITIAGIFVGFSPLFAVAAAIGAWLPDLDATAEWFHRSWALHTFLPPSIVYPLIVLIGLDQLFPFLLDAVHFLTLGMCAHFFLDYVYPRDLAHDGTEWPIRPTIWSMPWGFLWLGLAWMYQWLFYLSRHFLPWMVGLGA